MRRRQLGIESFTCPECGCDHEYYFSICEECMDKRMEPALAKREEEEKRSKQARWQKICPKDFRSTNWDNPQLSPTCRVLAKNWWPPTKGLETGLGIYGTTGKGKTRAMFDILSRLYWAGWDVYAVTSVTFARAASDFHASNHQERQTARNLIRRAGSAGILLLDDIAKERATPAVSSALHELLSQRGSANLPTLWTSERTGAEMAPFFGENYADGIIRRLREKSHIEEALPSTQQSLALA